MIGPQLQKAIVAALKRASIAGGRVYDSIPAGATFPYVEVAEEQTIDDGDQCADMFDVFTDIHVWSRAVGKVEAKQIGEAVRSAITAPLTVEDYSVILHEFDNARIMTDPDGLTSHGILTFRFLLQPV